MNIDASLLQSAARAAAGAQQYPAGALYVVATPIGNLADITLRAIHVLALADRVACEDTRVGAGLLRHLGLAGKPLLALHEHNEVQASAQVLQHLAAGERVALVSDAGTPAISDPGARLVHAVRRAGGRVVPVPGVSSVAAALSAAGDVSDRGFRFTGFLPAKGAERTHAVAALAQSPATTVLFEAPHRIERLADELAAVMPTRPVTLARELTKQFESIVTLPAAELPDWLRGDDDRRRGEFVIVLHAAEDAEAVGAGATVDPVIDDLLQAVMIRLPLSQAAALVSQACGRPRKALYARALALKAQMRGGAIVPDD